MTQRVRDITRCPTPRKEAHQTEASARTALDHWRRKRGDRSAVYICPCGAWHSGRQTAQPDMRSVLLAPVDTPQDQLTWDRTHCEWCWWPMIRGRRRDDEAAATQVVYCSTWHERRHENWLSSCATQRVGVRRCDVCGVAYEYDLDNCSTPKLYCTAACRRNAKRARRRQERLDQLAAELVWQSKEVRQDPEVIAAAFSFFRAVGRVPWPAFDVVEDPELPDGRVEVDAHQMPARVTIGTGLPARLGVPDWELDWTARDAVWIVWDGLLDHGPGLREIAEWAGLREPQRLTISAEWLTLQLAEIPRIAST